MPDQDTLDPIPSSWLQVGDVRSFDPTPLSPDEMTEILAAASLAPSAANVQPWEFVALTDPAARAEITALAQNPLTRIRALSLGISSAWIRAIDLQAVAKCLALPRELVPQAVLAFGRSAQMPERVPHLRVSDFVRWIGGSDAEV